MFFENSSFLAFFGAETATITSAMSQYALISTLRRSTLALHFQECEVWCHHASEMCKSCTSTHAKRRKERHTWRHQHLGAPFFLEGTMIFGGVKGKPKKDHLCFLRGPPREIKKKVEKKRRKKHPLASQPAAPLPSRSLARWLRWGAAPGRLLEAQPAHPLPAELLDLEPPKRTKTKQPAGGGGGETQTKPNKNRPRAGGWGGGGGLGEGT